MGMKPLKTRVALLVGGPSSEHDVSLNSGRVVHASLDKDKYEIIPVLINRKGEWPIEPKHLKDVTDVAFIAMHGEYGEDGTVQEILKDLGIPYTGSDHMASALAMNKILSRRLFRAHGMNVPNSVVFNTHESAERDWSDIPLPAVVKPSNRGSSLGVGIARTIDEVKLALERAFAHSKSALIEEHIQGRELNCGVIDDGMGHAFPLPVTEIVPKFGIFDYNAKYTPGAAEAIIPARILEREAGLAQAVALRAHELVGAAGFSSTDMILGEDGNLYVLEIDTIPGMTENSLLLKAALSHGMTRGELFDRIIEAAFIKHAAMVRR